MIILNLGCGGEKLPPPFLNVDILRSVFPEGTVERSQIDALPNYLEADLRERLPFEDLSIDGCFLSHIVEHFPADEGMRLLQECYRIMKPGAPILVSVPDASYFKSVHPDDTNANWPRLFGIIDPKNPIPTFFEAALWFNEHKAILTEDSLWCYFRMAGFLPTHISKKLGDLSWMDANPTWKMMGEKLNRRIFSLEMFALK